jgi:hypothetical protein
MNNSYAEYPFDKRKAELVLDLELDEFIINTNEDIKACQELYVKYEYSIFHNMLENIETNMLPKIGEFLASVEITAFKDMLEANKTIAQLAEIKSNINKFREAIAASDKAVENTIRGGGELSSMERITQKNKSKLKQ